MAERDEEKLRVRAVGGQREMQTHKVCISGLLRRENLSDFLVESDRCPVCPLSGLLAFPIPRSCFAVPLLSLSGRGRHRRHFPP